MGYSFRKRNKQITAFRLLFSLLFSFPISGFSQVLFSPEQVAPLTEPWRWNRFPELDGEGVRCMDEARDGTFWFGTNHGAICYNGMDWMRPDSDSSLCRLIVNQILVAVDQSVYAATDSGLYRYSNQCWKRIFPRELNPKLAKLYKIRKIHQLANGALLVATGQTFYSGLLYIKDETIAFFSAESTLKSLKKLNVDWDLRTIPNELNEDKGFYVEDFFVDKDETIWGIAAPEKAHISVFHFQFNQQTTAFTSLAVYGQKDGIHNAYRNSIARVGNEIWVANGVHNVGITVFNGIQWRYIEPDNTICDDYLHTTIVRTSDGAIWLGGLGLIYAIQNGKWVVYKNPKLSIPNARFELFEDSKGFLWIIGIQNEVFRVDYSSSIWTTYRGLNYQCETPDGQQLFITYDGKVVFHKQDRWYLPDKEPNLISVPVKAICSKNGWIWVVGSHNNTAAVSCFNGKSWSMFLFPELSWGIDYRSVFEDRSGNIWVGGAVDINLDKRQKAGVVQFKPNNRRGYDAVHFAGRESTFMYNAYGIGQTRNGLVWVGGSHLASFDGKTWIPHYIPVEQYQHQECIKNINGGCMWVGSRFYGIYCFDDTTCVNYNSENGLLSNNVISILPITDLNVWVGTDKDISRFDGQNWTNNLFPGSMTLTREGGELLQGTDNSLWINKALREWKRRMLTNGRLDDKVRENFCTYNYKPDKRLPETLVLNSPGTSSFRSSIVLNWTGKDYFNNTPVQRLSYSYRINGGTWSPFEEKSYITFWGLKDGLYTFEVRARDLDFNVDDTPARVEFRVLPPIWKQVWFLVLVVSFLLIITIYQVAVVRRNQRLSRLNHSLSQAKLILEQQKEQIVEQNRREQESMNARMHFFTNISHEFRTPLTLISGAIWKIMNRRTSNNLQGEGDELRSIDRNTNRLLQLINQLLDFRKLESGTMPLRASKGNVVKFIANLVANFNSLAEKQGVKIYFESQQEFIEVWFDADKLEKILVNLLSNAIKFTPEGGYILISVEKLETNYKIGVCDTGVGIEKEEQERIFEPFYQTKRGQSNTVNGTGLGLSLVKNLIERHHGTLTLKSKTDSASDERFSTCFEITFPLGNEFLQSWEMVDESNIGAQTELEGMSNKTSDDKLLNEIIDDKSEDDASKPLVLFVDDNEELRRFIYETLQSAFRLILASDGKEGFQKALEHTPDLVVSDVMMPGMNGIELCRAIKDDQRISHIPVILLTSKSAEDNYLEGYSSGADDYLVKPFSMLLLIARIRNLIAIRAALKKQLSRDLTDLSPTPMAEKVDDRFLHKIIALIEQRMSEPDFNVESLSAEVGISSRHLLNKLQSLTEYSPVELIRLLRLKEAARLLRETHLSISEVAYEVGFTSPGYFSKCFQKQFHLSPKEYVASTKK